MTAIRTFKTSEAAALLNVSANTLRVWERKFGFPRPHRSPGNQRLYAQAEIIALSDALGRGLAITSAISVARESHGADAQALIGALASFRGEPADRVMAGSLALRSVEQTLEAVLFPALDRIHQRAGQTSAVWAFAVGWSEEWLVRARRLGAAASQDGAVLFGDAMTCVLDPLRAYASALTLCCVRSGLEVLMLSTRAPDHVRDAVSSFGPTAIVVVGSSGDTVARWGYQASQAADGIPTFRYDRAATCRAMASSSRVVPDSPVKAAQHLVTAVAASTV